MQSLRSLDLGGQMFLSSLPEWVADMPLVELVLSCGSLRPPPAPSSDSWARLGHEQPVGTALFTQLRLANASFSK